MFSKANTKINKKSFDKAIISIDPYSMNSYAFLSNEFLSCDPNNISKNNFFISYLKYKDLIIGSIEIPKNSEEEDILDLITIKAYEEFDLDTANDYKIVYNELENTKSENRIFNIFIIQSSNINKIFSSITKDVPYIDYIVAAPLMFSGIYKKNLIPQQATDAFLVIQDDDAFLAVYENGEYTQSRPIRYSIKNMCEKFSVLREARIEEIEFSDILRHTTNKKHIDCIVQLFDEIGYYVSDIINNISRISNLKIKNLYIVNTKDLHLNELCLNIKEKTGISVSNLDINIAINKKDTNINITNILLTTIAQSYKEEKNNNFNFSPFLRPPPLFKRYSGKLILSIISGFFIAFAYPAYLYIYSLIVQQETNMLSEEYVIAKAEETRIKNELQKIATEYEEIKSLLNTENEKIEFRKNLLSEIYDKKTNYPIKSVVLFELSELISKKDIKIGKIINNDKNITIMLVSSDEKKLTEFIQNVSNEVKYSISTKEISHNNLTKTPIYESNVTIEIR